MASDLEALLSVLHRNDVRLVVVGGVAVGAHGAVRTTLDVDVVPDPDRENIERLVAALTQLEATIPSGKRFDPSAHARALRQGRNATLMTKYGGLDIIQRLDGVPEFPELDAEAVEAVLTDVPVRVCSLRHLRAMKVAAGRTQDLVDLEKLPDA